MNRLPWQGRKRSRNETMDDRDKPKGQHKRRRPISFMPLEPRVMYDGAAAATAHHAYHPHEPGHAPAPGGSHSAVPPAAQNTWTPAKVASDNGNNDSRSHGDWATHAANANPSGLQPGEQVVFVDSQITNYQAIVAAIDPGVKVFVFDGTQDGLQEIAQDLKGAHGLASIDIISPGAADAVQVGTDTLTTSTISTYSADLAAIGKALAPHGQLDLYGGDVTGAGDGFLTALQQATGRNVAASTDPIGATARGGTWTLDATTGPTPDALPANLTELQSFDGLLMNPEGLRPGDQVVFVDSQITDYQAIVAAINPGVTVIVYDGTQDGLAEIAQDLQGAYGLASVDIISHGAVDQVQVGTDTLTTSTISNYSADLTAIGNALAPSGQLDLYGCDVAAAGDGFLTALQQATGRNVAASTDPIGATALGGTWTLDASTGPTPDALPADLTAIQSFDGVLLSPTAEIYVPSNATGSFNNGSGGDNTGVPVDSVQINSTATDSAGDLFVVGTFRGTAYFGYNSSNAAVSLYSNDGTASTSSTGTASSVFIVKYNSSGVVQWAEELTGATSSPASYGFTGNSIAVSADGSQVVLGGSYMGGTYPSANYPAPIGSDYPGIDALTNYQGQSQGTISITSQNANTQGFVVDLNSSGALQWDAYFYGSGGAAHVALDSSGNVYVAGPYQNEDLQQYSGEQTIPANKGNTQFVDSTGSIVISSFPGNGSDGSAALIKLSSAGRLAWLDTIVGSSNPPVITGLAIDPSSGNLYMTGNFSGGTFNSTAPTITSSSIGAPLYTGAFLTEVTPSSGAFDWVDTFDGDSIAGVAFDATGPVVTGTFQNGSILVPGSATEVSGLYEHKTYASTSAVSYSSTRVFVEQFSRNGTSAPTEKWVATETGDNSGFSSDEATSITVDAAGNVVVGGYIQDGYGYGSGYGASDATTLGTGATNAAYATFGSTGINYPTPGSAFDGSATAFVWDLTSGTSSATTNFAGIMPGSGSSDSSIVVGLEATSGGGVLAVLNIDGKFVTLPNPPGAVIGTSTAATIPSRAAPGFR